MYELVCILSVYSLCNLPSAHLHALMVASRFSLENIKYLSVFLYLSYDMSSFP